MDSENSILLVVDDESSVCRALKRLLRGKVGEIVIAETPTDAMVVLQTKPVTHVICDHLLGPGQPRGLELAQDWKSAFPTIKSVVILTGANIVNGAPPEGIDYVLPKTTDPLELAKLMKLEK